MVLRCVEFHFSPPDFPAMSAGLLALGMVQPWDCDMMGHFTVRRYAAAFDDASYQLLWALTGKAPVAPDAGLGWADVKQVYEYHAEMRAGDLYEVTGQPVKLGNSSVTAEYVMRLRGDRKIVARMTSSLVRFDLAARKAVPIEGGMRDRIEALLGNSEA